MAKEHSMRPVSFCLVVVASLALASCGSTSSSQSSTSSGGSTTSAGSGQTTGASTSSTATAPANLPARCTAAGLGLRFLGQQGATGHGEIGFAVRNVGARTCRTYGFPGILFLDQSGHPLPTNAIRKTHDLFGNAPAVALMLAPGSSASFRIGVTHGINSSVGCHTAYGLQVIPPNDTASLRTTIPQGAYECTDATVSPLRPGTSAYP